MGLWFDREMNAGATGIAERKMEVYTDASFAPGGGLSHGSVVVLWNGAPLAWKSSRQSSPTLSTGEAELMECLEGIIMGESVEALISEIEEAMGCTYKRQLLSDSSAAIAITSEAGGSWRTRHLRVRAFNLRWRLMDESWSIHHVMGETMLADLGTKALTGRRIDDLRRLWRLEPLEEVVEEISAGQENTKEANGHGDLESMTAMVKVMTLASMITKVQAKEKVEADGEEEPADTLKVLMTVVSVMSIILYKLVELVCQRAVMPRIRAMRSGGVPEPDEEEEEVVLEETSSTIRRTVGRNGEGASRSASSTGGGPAFRGTSWGEGGTTPQSASSTGGGGSRRLGATPKPMPKRKGYGKGRVVTASQRPRQQLEPEPEAEEVLPGDGDLPTVPILYRTDHGERYHTFMECYGLQNATLIHEMLPCPRCCTPDFRRLVTSLPGPVFYRWLDHYHSLMCCAGGDPVRITLCGYCRTA